MSHTPKTNSNSLCITCVWVAVLAPARLQQTAQAMKALHIREHPGTAHMCTQIQSTHTQSRQSTHRNEMT